MARKSRRYDRYLRYSTVGLEMGLSVIIGLFVGQWLDKQFGTEPWLLLVFLLFGMVAGFRSIFRLARHRHDNEDDEASPPDVHPPP
jgi:ATP synthase protein I